ncbi:MAG: LysE family translocator [Actinobacteria bacterium]|nr:LysE family translocator [Actinomycetota bacterium]
MPETSNLIAFISATAVLLLIPGPAIILNLNRTLADGRSHGLATVAGLEIGDTIQALLAALGISAVLATSISIFNAIKWGGVVYLIFTGVKTLLTSPDEIHGDPTHTTLAQSFRQGIIVNALNPKTSLFFLSIFPQFVDAKAANAKVQSLVLGLVFVVLATIFNGSYTLVASGLRDWLFRGRAVYVMRRYVAGFAFIGLGLLAMTAGLPSGTD